MTEVMETQQTDALSAIARAALSAIDRTAFLPNAAREAARLLEADACEIWVPDTEGPALAAVWRRRDGAPRSLQIGEITAALSEPLQAGDWHAVPIPGDGESRGVVTVLRSGPFSAEDLDRLEGAAAVIGVGMAAASAGHFDEASRDQFLALLGHDLRSPLSNVRVGAQLARRNLEAGDIDSVREALTIIESQSARLVARLEALLDAVAASGRRLMRLETVDLGELAGAAMDPFRLAAEERGSNTKLTLEAGTDTPPIRGDVLQLNQVLEHLLDNATKYGAGGQVTVTVKRDGNAVRLDVCDTGPGIRPEDVDRVFMPFGRGHAGAGREGYGLGLFLARNILTAHGGRLWIARTSRSGTCMAMSLPVAEEDDAAEA
jgi:signal transduction histidine kinase